MDVDHKQEKENAYNTEIPSVFTAQRVQYTAKSGPGLTSQYIYMYRESACVSEPNKIDINNSLRYALCSFNGQCKLNIRYNYLLREISSTERLPNWLARFRIHGSVCPRRPTGLERAERWFSLQWDILQGADLSAKAPNKLVWKSYIGEGLCWFGYFGPTSKYFSST